MGSYSDCDPELRTIITRADHAARALISAALAFGFLACEKEPEVASLATVGERRLTQDDVDLMVPVQMMGKLSPQARRRIVEAWVEDELLVKEARRLKIHEDPEVGARIAGAVRDLLVAELLERHFVDDSEVSEEAIQLYYSAQPEDFTREELEIRARHILVTKRSERRTVLRTLKTGLFDVVARESSIDASADVGGDLGYFTRRMVDPAFWTACEAAKLGRRITPRTPLGYHFIEVLDRHEAGSVKDLSEVRGEIRQRILAERRQAKRLELLVDLRSRIPWDIVEQDTPPVGEENGL